MGGNTFPYPPVLGNLGAEFIQRKVMHFCETFSCNLYLHSSDSFQSLYATRKQLYRLIDQRSPMASYPMWRDQQVQIDEEKP